MAIIFIFLITNKVSAQTLMKTMGDTISAINKQGVLTDTGKVVIDSIRLDSVRKDSLAAASDTSKRGKMERALGIKISRDELQAVVTATAADSAVMDMQHNMFYLYKKAKVDYQDVELNAGQVTFAQGSNLITASRYSKLDDTEKQVFSQGKEKFTYDSMQYNFKSKRAIVRNVHTQYGEGYMFSEQIKRNPDQTIYGWHSVYTTCALDTPHYGINAKKIIVIPNHAIISGPCNITIEGIPTPLYLPFGIFPSSEKQKSGFILPTYTIEDQRGLGLLNGGYYFYFNDYVDLAAQANVYTKGSYAFSGITDYNDIYHYRGSFHFSYALNKTGEDFEPGATTTKDFMVNWSHSSDPKSIPGQTFNASVEAGTSSFYSNNSYDPNQILQNQYSSNISYAKNWQGEPFGLTISALHNQNTATHQINVTLPSVNFHVTQVNPFQNKTHVKQKWYDKITSSYNVDLLNRTTFYDSTLNLSKLLSVNNFQTGIHHSIPISASYTIFRYINMSFSVNYDEYWLTNKLYQRFDSVANKIDSANSYGFYTARDFNAGVSFSTRIYGMKLFKKGKLRGIRHVLTPSVSFTYHPDFGASPFNYYYRTRLDTLTNPLNYSYLSPYASSIVGYPPYGKAGLVNFGVNNNLQIKVRSSKDTVTGFKNITLIDALGANISYNPAVDSFQWSMIALNFRTNVLDKLNINSTANFDPYAIDYNTGRRLPETMEDEGFGLARFSSATLALGFNYHAKPKDGSLNPSNSEEYGRLLRNAGYNDYVDFKIPWSVNLSYSFNANNQYSSFSKRDTIVVAHSLMLAGELQLTTRWKATINTGFNFNEGQLVSTSIDIYRDLHCWQMHFQTIPFGPRKSFNFTLNVKSSALQDLKLTRRRDYRDSPQ